MMHPRCKTWMDGRIYLYNNMLALFKVTEIIYLKRKKGPKWKRTSPLPNGRESNLYQFK